MIAKFTQVGDHCTQVEGTLINNGLPNINPPAPSSANRISGCRSFVSVSTDEAPVAEVVQKWIDQLFPEAAPCFVAETSLRFGDRWLEKVEDALAGVRIFCVIFSKLSFQKHWLHFEFGAAWIRRCPIMVLTHSGLQMKDLPTPYSTFQGGSLDSPADIKKLLDGLAHQLNRPPITVVDPQTLAQQVLEAKKVVRTP